MENIADIIREKGLFTHARQCMAKIRDLLPLRQICICEAILLGLGHVTRVDPLGHPYKFGKNPQGNGSYEFLKFPIVAYGRLATGE